MTFLNPIGRDLSRKSRKFEVVMDWLSSDQRVAKLIRKIGRSLGVEIKTEEAKKWAPFARLVLLAAIELILLKAKLPKSALLRLGVKHGI